MILEAGAAGVQFDVPPDSEHLGGEDGDVQSVASALVHGSSNSHSNYASWRKVEIKDVPQFKTGDLGAFPVWKQEFMAWLALKGPDSIFLLMPPDLVMPHYVDGEYQEKSKWLFWVLQRASM